MKVEKDSYPFQLIRVGVVGRSLTLLFVAVLVVVVVAVVAVVVVVVNVVVVGVVVGVVVIALCLKFEKKIKFLTRQIITDSNLVGNDLVKINNALTSFK